MKSEQLMLLGCSVVCSQAQEPHCPAPRGILRLSPLFQAFNQCSHHLPMYITGGEGAGPTQL